MNFGIIFAYINMFLCLSAAVGYLIAKDYRQAIYWFSAFMLTGSVTIK